MEFKEVFKNELNQIKNQEFKSACLQMLEGLPKYIMAQPSSTTGKYHPTDEINKNGMIIHIKRCTIVADEIARKDLLTPDERDVLIAGCIFHDALKMGPTEVGEAKVYTDSKHPIYIYEYIKKYYEEHYPESTAEPSVVEYMIMWLAKICLHHEGQWTIPEAAALSPKKKNRLGFLCDEMHTVDYIASRRSMYEMMQKEFFSGI